jgi:hypothetical protein
MIGFRITIEHYDKKLVLDTSSERFEDVLDEFLGLMAGVGFMNDSIEEGILDKAEEYKDEDIYKLGQMWRKDEKAPGSTEWKD